MWLYVNSFRVCVCVCVYLSGPDYVMEFKIIPCVCVCVCVGTYLVQTMSWNSMT
jgi:hypothetical protein